MCVPWFHLIIRINLWNILYETHFINEVTEIREVGWKSRVTWILEPQSSALFSHECPRDPGTHWHQNEKRQKKMRERENLRLIPVGLEGPSWNNHRSFCPLSSPSAGHILSNPYLSMLSALGTLGQGQPAFSTKGQTVNILCFVGCMVSNFSTLPRWSIK